MIEKMNSEKFRWDNSARATYTSVTVLWEFENARPLAKVLGYCDAGLVTVLPNPDHYAVMFALDNEEVWIHVDKSNFERYLVNNLSKKQKKRYRRYIYGTHYYTYAFSDAQAHRNLIKQAKAKIGKYDLNNPLEIEKVPGSNIFLKLTSHCSQ